MVGLLTADSTAIDVLTVVISSKISGKMLVLVSGIDFKKPNEDGVVEFVARAYDRTAAYRPVKIKGFIGSTGDIVITSAPAGVYVEV